MSPSLSTPCSGCPHNLNFHSMIGRNPCHQCECAAFTPKEEPVPVDKSQCRAHYKDGDGFLLRCEIEVAEGAFHLEDHKAAVEGGHTLRWTNAVAVYPLDDPNLVTSARDSQVAGDHYKRFKIQPWDIWQEYGLDAFTGTVVKYLLRAGHKGSRLEDLKKARHTLDALIEHLEQDDGQA